MKPPEIEYINDRKGLTLADLEAFVQTARTLGYTDQHRVKVGRRRLRRVAV